MASIKMISLLLLGLLFAANLQLSDAQLGVAYDTQFNKTVPPSAQDLLGVLAANKITKLRLYQPDKDILSALKGKNVEVLLGMPNTVVGEFEKMPFLAEQWVEEFVTPFVPDVKIKYIVVGTELSRNNAFFEYSKMAPIAVQTLHNALQKQGIKDVKVTLNVDTSVLIEPEAAPLPSTREAKLEALDLFNQTLPLLRDNGTPLTVSMYPYYELIKHPNEIKLDFALFTSPGNVVTDGKLGYQNKFDVLLDSYYAALEKMGFPDMEIIVAETGWPSAGGQGATLENEKTYITNLVNHVKKGTPKRPNKPIEVYVNMYDEDGRGKPVMEKNFGVFTGDGKLKFPVAFGPSA